MKEIAGIDLGALLKEECDARHAETVRKIRVAIGHVLSEIETRRVLEAKAKRAYEQAAEKLAKAESWLAQLQAGNWAVLEEPKEGNDKPA